jgi:outer membrane protein TolC
MYAVDRQVEEIYFGILLMQEQQDLLEDMTERLENNLSHLNAMVENGMATQADADELEVQILKTNQNLVQVKSREHAFRKMLSLLVGEDLSGSTLPMPVSAEPLEQTPLIPELKLYDSQIELLQAQNSMLNVSLMPKFGLFAQGYYGYPGLDMFGSMASSKWSINGIVGVQMTWNISSFYTVKTSRRQITNSIDRIKMTKDVFLFNNQLQKEQESAEIQRIRDVLKYDDEIVSLHSRVREAAEARLQEGVIDTFSLLNKISEETSAKIARSTHEIELIKAIYDLKHTLNR